MRRSRAFWFLQRCAKSLPVSLQCLGTPRKNHHGFQQHPWRCCCLVMPVVGAAPSCSSVLLAWGGGGRGGLRSPRLLSEQAESSAPWAPGPKLSPSLRALNPFSHIRLMSRKEFLKYVPSSLLVYPLGFFSSDGTTMRHLPRCQTRRRVGSSVHKQRARCLWQLVQQPSRVSFHFNGSHTSLHVCV